jgi:hypothetical protein
VTIIESSDHNERRRGGVERHIQTILTMGVAALLAWQLSTIEEMRVELAILAGRVDALAARVDDASADRYRTADAERDLALRDQVIQGLDYRVKRVEEICATQKEGSK